MNKTLKNFLIAMGFIMCAVLLFFACLTLILKPFSEETILEEQKLTIPETEITIIVRRSTQFPNHHDKIHVVYVGQKDRERIIGMLDYYPSECEIVNNGDGTFSLIDENHLDTPVSFNIPTT